MHGAAELTLTGQIPLNQHIMQSKGLKARKSRIRKHAGVPQLEHHMAQQALEVSEGPGALD